MRLKRVVRNGAGKEGRVWIIASLGDRVKVFNPRADLLHNGLDLLDLLAVQETLKSLLQHHSSKASVLWRSAFFIVQLSYPYLTTGLDPPLLAK